ncbi:hypothetical protein E2P81_ATG12085 [Venturia nashicola]|nr:hypothetical protein E2P81_ATG12085 [Venturia nashicola]
MRSTAFQYLLSAAVAVSAREPIFGSNLGICGASSLDSSSWNPVCTRNSESAGIDLEIHLPSNTHRAANKPDQVRLSASNKIPDDWKWSRTPECLREQNMTEKFCLFTSHEFAHNRGISLWTTPEHSEELLKLPAFTNPDLLRGVNEEPNPPYESRQLPGRGMGLIANRTLQKGDHIFSMTPVVMIEEKIFDIFAKSDRLPYLRTMVKRLPERSEKRLMDLCGHFGGDPAEDIINTNAFAIDMWEDDDDEETAYNVVFPEISRLNHDCRPNAHYYFDPETLVQNVHAIRTILPGEELTISYIDPAQIRSERQHQLHQSWGFQCSCSLCTQPKAHTDASDARIEHIASLREELEDYSPESEATTSMAELLVSLYEQERLYGPIAEAHALAAIEFNGVGEPSTAQKYARLAVETGLLYGGPADKDVKEMEKLLKDPWAHWSWMLRTNKRMEVAGTPS